MSGQEGERMGSYLLGIDAGATKTAFALYDLSADRTWLHLAGCGNHEGLEGGYEEFSQMMEKEIRTLLAYAGAGIAKSNPMTTAVQACKIGFAGFIVPFVFCYNSALNLNGTLGQILMVCGTALVGCFGMSCGMQGWYFSGQRKISWLMRIIIIGAGLCMMIPSDLLSIVGLVILVLAAIFEKSRNAKKVSAAV